MYVLSLLSFCLRPIDSVCPLRPECVRLVDVIYSTAVLPLALSHGLPPSPSIISSSLSVSLHLNCPSSVYPSMPLFHVFVRMFISFHPPPSYISLFSSSSSLFFQLSLFTHPFPQLVQYSLSSPMSTYKDTLVMFFNRQSSAGKPNRKKLERAKRRRSSMVDWITGLGENNQPDNGVWTTR